MKAGGTGAYTDSKGEGFIREAIADFINKRDGFKNTGSPAADPERIFLTSGASQGVKFVIDLLIAQSSDGIMVPIPQYPLYSATIKKAGGVQVNYYPDEDSGWIFDRYCKVARLIAESLHKSGIEDPELKVLLNEAGSIEDEMLRQETDLAFLEAEAEEVEQRYLARLAELNNQLVDLSDEKASWTHRQAPDLQRLAAIDREVGELEALRVNVEAERRQETVAAARAQAAEVADAAVVLVVVVGDGRRTEELHRGRTGPG